MTAELVVRRLAERTFRVEVHEALVHTTHEVSVPQRLAGGPPLLDDDLERIVRASFGFLLEREPASSILERFSLEDIAGYFPEYPGEITRRLR